MRDPLASSPLDPAGRRRRREERRRELRMRRLAAGGMLLATLCAIGAVILLARGGSSEPKPQTSAGQRTAHHAVPSAPGRDTSAGTAASGPTGPPGQEAVPILMYHVIAPPPAGAPFPGLYVPPGEFAEQVAALKAAGWHAVTPDQVRAYWLHGVPLGPGKPIVLSFDNGYESQFTQAFPVLRRAGWVAEENIQLSGLPPSQGGIGRRELGELVQAGWELDTQGYDHADLITLDATALRFQIATTREVIRRRYHVPVNWFCYPSGHYDATVIAAVRAAGYVGSTTVVPGWAKPTDDPYRLPRLRVLGGTSGPELLSELAAIRDNPPAPASYSGA